MVITYNLQWRTVLWNDVDEPSVRSLQSFFSFGFVVAVIVAGFFTRHFHQLGKGQGELSKCLLIISDDKGALVPLEERAILGSFSVGGCYRRSFSSGRSGRNGNCEK